MGKQDKQQTVGEPGVELVIDAWGCALYVVRPLNQSTTQRPIKCIFKNNIGFPG